MVERERPIDRESASERKSERERAGERERERARERERERDKTVRAGPNEEDTDMESTEEYIETPSFACTRREEKNETPCSTAPALGMNSQKSVR